MKLKNLDAAIAEAERFLERAKRLQGQHVDDPFPPTNLNDYTQTAAVRRASMDLTRALATLRNDN